MKREIKFRLWDKEEKKMYSYNLFEIMYQWCEKHLQIPEDYAGQYTGLKDKNGVDIYEGDICRILYTDWISQSDYSITLEQHKKNISSIGIVEYNAPLWQLSIWDEKYKEYIPACIEHGTHGEIEVIGNIHEHHPLTN